MKFFIILLLATYSSLSYSSSLKIGVIDMDKTINKTKEFIQFNEEINKYINIQNNIIEQLELDKQNKNKQISLKMLSQNGIESNLNEIQKINEKINDIVNNAERHIQKEETKIKNKIIRNLIPIIKKYSKDHNYSLIVDITTIVYDSNIQFIDISNDISSIYNNN